MTPEQARASYRRQIRNGETITLRRDGSPPIDKPVRARVTGYAPEELVGDVHQGDRRIVVLAEDVASTGFPVPFRDGFDKVILRGDQLTIQSSDDSTRRIAGELIAYELRAAG